MEDPIKIIHKYKNANKRVQYHIHIFIGAILNNDVLDVLEKIRELSLIDSLKTLSKKEIKILCDYYGEFWYQKFFNIHHIEKSFKDPKIFEALSSNFSKEWIDLHVGNYQKNLLVPVPITYEFSVNRLLERSKKKDVIIDQGDGLELEMSGGSSGNEEEEDDVDLIFKEVDTPNPDTKKITENLKEVIQKSNYEKFQNIINDFDTAKYDNMFDDKLENNYKKYYVQHYIYKDDNINTIKKKICCGIKNHPIFTNNQFILPSMQYLWSEYLFENKYHKIMIGQKWILNNSILSLDVEPNTKMDVYENLQGKIMVLRTNLKRFNKIKYDNNSNYILDDYHGFYSNNEIYMLDVNNELGKKYNPSTEVLNNLLDVYFKIYFYHLDAQMVKTIIATNSKNEPNNFSDIYQSINNDLLIESEIMNYTEMIKRDEKNKYDNYLGSVNVTYANIRTYIKIPNMKTFFFQIFDNFITDATYPFVHFKDIDGIPKRKYYNDFTKTKGNQDLIVKWFDTNLFGMMFKVKFNETKYISVFLNDSGRIEYKINWKEIDMVDIDSIKSTYQNIYGLLEKIKLENKSKQFELELPKDYDFYFSFINTIQKINLPKKTMIDHNELSDFARFYFPYIALVIDPSKRKSYIVDEDGSSKFGTYLRYKRVSEYENKKVLDNRIIYFMKNYEYNDTALSNEISREFNLTVENAMNEIERVRTTYAGIKKTRKKLKKLDNIPKVKLSGIDVEIQGKTAENYKLRVAGTKSLKQFNNIKLFMSIFIYMYTEIYQLKNKEKQKFNLLLKKITNIAKRKNKVKDVVVHESIRKDLKESMKIDENRLKKTDTNEKFDWPRSCQNYGNNKRRPKNFVEIEQLYKMGYKWNEKLDEFNFGHFEKKTKVDGKNVTLRALKLPLDKKGKDFIYYVCSPEENNDNIYVGFLGKKGNNAPCCFKKDQLYSKKRNLFLQGIGLVENMDKEDDETGNQLYVLKEIKNLQEDRIAFLPTQLDVFTNYVTKKTRIMDEHLLECTEAYYFGYGIKNNKNIIGVLEFILEKESNDIIKMAVNALIKDSNEKIFNSLLNGKVKNAFGTAAKFIQYLKDGNWEFNMIVDLALVPGVFTSAGIYLVLFEKIGKKSFQIRCDNDENINEINIKDKYIVYWDKEEYSPIVSVAKLKKDKNIKVQKEINDLELINHIHHYLTFNYINISPTMTDTRKKVHINTKSMITILLASQQVDLKPVLQIVDDYHKCIYIVTAGNYLIPVVISGSHYHYPISTSCENLLLDPEDTWKYLEKINITMKNKILIKPIGYSYESEDDKSYIINFVITENYDYVPVKKKKFSKPNKLVLEKHIEHGIIDDAIKGHPNNKVINEQIEDISLMNYRTEMYQLFRYHLNYLFVGKCKTVATKINNIVYHESMSRETKINKLKHILYQMIHNHLANKFAELLVKMKIETEPIKMLNNEYFEIDNDVSYLDYVMDNSRKLCFSNKTGCKKMFHCKYVDNTCKFRLPENLYVYFVNKIVAEMMDKGMKYWELIGYEGYYVSDIINFDVFHVHPNESIYVGSNIDIRKVISNLYGDKVNSLINENYQLEPKRHNEVEMIESDQWYIQEVHTDHVYYRSFVNAYYWLMNPLYTNENRNLGFRSELQEKFIYYYHGKVNQYLLDSNNVKKLKKVFEPKMVELFKKDSINQVTPIYNYEIYYFILSDLFQLIIYVYSNKKIKNIFHYQDGIINILTAEIIKKYQSYLKKLYFEINKSDHGDLDVIEVMYPKKNVMV